MDAVKAIKILRSMDSSGRIIGEDTGEVGTLNLAEDSLARSIINKIINCSLEDLQMLMNHAIGSPKRRGFPWTSKEEHEVANLFSNGVEIKDNDALTSFSIDSLTDIGGNLEIYSNSVLCQSLLDAFVTAMRTLGWEGEENIFDNADC